MAATTNNGGRGGRPNTILFLLVLAIGVLISHHYALNGFLPEAETENKEHGAPSARQPKLKEELQRCFNNAYDNGDYRGTKNDATDGDPAATATAAEIIRREPPCSGLKTLDEVLARVELPCNYVHDGFYLHDSNVIVSEIYSSLAKILDESEESESSAEGGGKKKDPSKIVPVIAEIGGHDGITKSQTLKASRCLHVNTLLIEATPALYEILRKSRSYDTTVHAALCRPSNVGTFVEIAENAANSGENRIIHNTDNINHTAQVPCTTLDDEIEAMRSMLPGGGVGYEMRLLFLVLDVEGHEGEAIQGVREYIPDKAQIETKYNRGTTASGDDPVARWVGEHGLVGKECGNGNYDVCFNFDDAVPNDPKHQRYNFPPSVFYGARKSIPDHTWKTSIASKAYMHYGK